MAEQFEISKKLQEFLKKSGSRSAARVLPNKDVNTFVSTTTDAHVVPADGQATP